MDLKYNTKQIIAVEYPGTVISVDNMCKTLGGEKTMHKAFQDSTKRLELRFRPADPYCKCAHGDRFNTTNIFLKVVKRTKKRKEGHHPKEGDVQLQVEFLGVACNTYKFRSLSDFQILPVAFDQTTKVYKSLLPDIVPTTLHPASWLDQEMDIFVPPILFSRFDLPQNGYVDIVSKQKMNEVQKLPANIIGRCRKRRAGFAVFATFESSESWTKPQPESVAQLKLYAQDTELKKNVDKLFEERPVWSKNALADRLKVDRVRLKYTLPCCAYYFTNGPWRALWVRFGFDPRKNPSAKSLQTMDLRIHPSFSIEIKCKRNMGYTLPNKSVQHHRTVPTIIPSFLMPIKSEEGEEEEPSASEDMSKSGVLTWQYIPGELPLARQNFYQLCDIHLEGVQNVVHANDGREDGCHEKEGWCEPGTLEKCRELILADMQKTLKAKEM